VSDTGIPSKRAKTSVLTGAGITALMQRVVSATATAAEVHCAFRGRPSSVAAARTFVRQAVHGCPRAEDLVLAVSEMATNAIAWSAAGNGGSYVVRVRTASRWARVEVADPGPAPLPAAGGNGWGLGIVAAFTDRSGSMVGPCEARVAWAEVTWPDALA
jgi:serine/threonine-protein kinase RsbW